MSLKKILTTCTLLLFLSACAAKEKPINLALEYPNDTGKDINIKEYLNGNLDGWGFIEDANGVVQKRFTAKVKGSWDGDKAVIKRQFSFDDKTKDNRTWLITLEDDNFSAIGHGVIGTAQGQQYRGIAKIAYNLTRSIDGQKQKTNVTETTYNVDGKSSISILEFRSGKSYKGKMILSLHKVAGKKSKKAAKVKSINLDQDKKEEAKE